MRMVYERDALGRFSHLLMGPAERLGVRNRRQKHSHSQETHKLSHKYLLISRYQHTHTDTSAVGLQGGQEELGCGSLG